MKNNGIFGADQTRRGAHIPNQSEWNDFTGAVTNVSLGDNNFMSGSVDGDGTNIPYDSFFFPHTAHVEIGDTQALIGPDREEEWYPYLDTVSVPAVVQRDYFVLDGNQYKYTGISDRDTFTNGVVFTTASSITPAKPTDNSDAAIVGYEWILIPEVTGVVFDGDSMIVDTQWAAELNFNDDPQASIYTIDSADDSESWAPSSYDLTTYEWMEDIINTFLTSEAVANISLRADSDWEVWHKDVKIPVGAYSWNIGQTKIDRVVQLYFGGAAPSAGGAPAQGSPYVFDHPFKGELTAEQTLTIGKNRASASYKFKDLISIVNPADDAYDSITYPAAETINLTASTDFYVYYDIYYGSGAWQSTLKKSDSWPPVASNGNILKLIGYAAATNTGSTDTFVWGQEMFDCPNEVTAPIVGEFMPYYDSDGFVTISAGTVETLNGDSASFAAASFDLVANTEIWITATSDESTGEPTITFSGLNSGTYPGFEQVVSGAQVKYNYKIGETLGGKYIPAHVGRLHIDATLLLPNIDPNYTSDDQIPRLMVFHDNQPATVGNASNDTLFDGMCLLTEVNGGNINKMVESTVVKFYGLSETDTYAPFDMSATSGADYNDGSIVFNWEDRDYSFARGLVQDFTGTNDLFTVLAGPGIKITGTAFTATIEAEQEISTITVITGIQLDASNNLQIKTRDVRVVEMSAETSFTTVTGWTTTACSV